MFGTNDRITFTLKYEENIKELERIKAHENYQQTLQVAQMALVPNSRPFECPVCFDEIQANEGVVLRECLHKFCRFVYMPFWRLFCTDRKITFHRFWHYQRKRVKRLHEEIGMLILTVKCVFCSP